MKKKAAILIILAAVVIGSIGVIFFRPEKDPDRIQASGNIEIKDVQMGFKIAGRVEICLVDEGDRVRKGDVLARMENQDQQILVALAEARLSRSRSLLAELEAGSRVQEVSLAHSKVLQARQALLELTRGSRTQEVAAAEADLKTAQSAEESARSQLAYAKSEADRFSQLYKQDSVSLRDLENIQTRYEVAENQVKEAMARVDVARQALSLRKEGARSEQIDRARAVLMQAEAEYALVKSGPRIEKIDQAKAAVAEAEQSLNQARQQLEYTRLISPMDGVVLSRSAEPGEFLNPSTPAFTIGDLSRPWLRAYVTERDLGRISLKDKVRVTTDAFPDKSYGGVLTFISSQAEFTPKTVQTFEERVKLMFRIKVSLENPDNELKPGMPADAVIQIKAE